MSEEHFKLFIEDGLAQGFTKKQLHFLWDWINEIARGVKP